MNNSKINIIFNLKQFNVFYKLCFWEWINFSYQLNAKSCVIFFKSSWSKELYIKEAMHRARLLRHSHSM